MRELDLDAILAGGDEAIPEGHRSGIVALAGRANVGKSTLLNAVVGEKLAIVTPVPGTTRNVIRGVFTREDLQLVFVDTPGLMKPRTLLNLRLNDAVEEAWQGVDVICFVIDAAAGIGPGDRFVAERLDAIATPTVCVVNKEDRVSSDELIPVLVEAEDLGEFVEIVPTSATNGMNVARLTDVLAAYVPEGPRLFPTGMSSDQSESQLVAEIIREKFLTRVFEEVPHSIAVLVDEIDERATSETSDNAGQRPIVDVYATIYVERESQKGIVIGKGGRLIKAANTQARKELETLFGMKVYLDVRVKVAPDWQEDPKHLERFGF